MNKNNVPTTAERAAQIRQRDIQFRDKLILHDGCAVQVVEAFDTMVKVSGYKRPYVYLYEVKAHYPYVAA
jgi:O-methyltransferase involved in polyketide biosynthesis